MADFNTNQSAVVKCQNCGADMVYDPVIGKLHCSYCDGTRDIQRRVPIMRDYNSECKNGDVQYEHNLYICPNCGGEVKLPGFATAIKCPFCSATNVVKMEDIHGLKPDSILPFIISKDSAVLAGKKWIKRRVYAPHKLKKTFGPSNFKGIYFPSFSFTTNTISHYRGRLGETRTRTVGSGKNRHTETYIHWYNVSGTYARDFVDLSVEASQQLTQKELTKIEPFDFANIEAYNREYIAGFEAERYDTSLKDSFSIAQNEMTDIIKKEIVKQYHADHVEYLNVNSTYQNTKFRYALLPLWVCIYEYKKKAYRYIVNARTGKATGKAPVSPIRVIITVLFALGIIGLFAWLIISQKFVDDDVYYAFSQLSQFLLK